jgi:hypothetical protein
MFKAFKHGGVQYLAVSRQDGVSIVDADGKNYGSWYSVASFLEHFKKAPVAPVGLAELAVRSKLL